MRILLKKCYFPFSREIPIVLYCMISYNLLYFYIQLFVLIYTILLLIVKSKLKQKKIKVICNQNNPNKYCWRMRLQPIRTAAEITAQIKICPVRRVYLYQKYSQKAKELRLLGMSYEQIAKSLNISKKTIINAYKDEKV